MNNELCLDPDTHPTYFNMKTFIKALEDIAEIDKQIKVEPPGQEAMAQMQAQQEQQQTEAPAEPTPEEPVNPLKGGADQVQSK